MPDFALSGLSEAGRHHSVGRCPTLLIYKAFSLNLTAMASRYVELEASNMGRSRIFFIQSDCSAWTAGLFCLNNRTVLLEDRAILFSGSLDPEDGIVRSRKQDRSILKQNEPAPWFHTPLSVKSPLRCHKIKAPALKKFFNHFTTFCSIFSSIVATQVKNPERIDVLQLLLMFRNNLWIYFS